MSLNKTFTKQDLIDSGEKDMFGPGNAKLPKDKMLMMDRVTRMTDTGGAYNKGEIIAELDINPDLWFFGCHFTDDPVMPGCLGLDALWQLLGFYLANIGGKGRGRALGCSEVKFSGQVLPTNKKITYHLDIKKTINRKIVLGIADGTVSVDGEEIYRAKGLQVGLFTSLDSVIQE